MFVIISNDSVPFLWQFTNFVPVEDLNKIFFTFAYVFYKSPITFRINDNAFPIP